ncbi:MAG: NUDIX hydrolase [Anaerolineales bacterium]|nr:NUDIX hydrolase [Anaerolineales bacterium]
MSHEQDKHHEHDNRPPVRFCSACGAELERREAQGKIRPVCAQCGRIHFRDPKVAAGVLVLSEDRALLVRRRHEPQAGRWSLPAGFVDAGEDPRRAAERECREETGHLVEAGELVYIGYGREHAAGADITLVYQAELVGGKARASDDADAVRFVAPEDLPPLAFEPTEVVLGRWVEDELRGVL